MLLNKLMPGEYIVLTFLFLMIGLGSTVFVWYRVKRYKREQKQKNKS